MCEDKILEVLLNSGLIYEHYGIYRASKSSDDIVSDEVYDLVKNLNYLIEDEVRLAHNEC